MAAQYVLDLQQSQIIKVGKYTNWRVRKVAWRQASAIKETYLIKLIQGWRTDAYACVLSAVHNEREFWNTQVN